MRHDDYSDYGGQTTLGGNLSYTPNDGATLLRASVGEPCAVISAHRAADARAQGELRVSLSSPFEPRDAEGFRCPLFALDRVGDVAALLVRLLQDCRVADIRLLDGIHPDRVPGMTHPLLFKPDTIPLGAELRLH